MQNHLGASDTDPPNRFLGATRRAGKTISKTGLLLCTFLALSAPANVTQAGSEAPNPTIDLAQFEPSFREDFDSLDLSNWGCLTRWIAHTPWAGDFGDARFIGPGTNSPFSTQEGILTIRARLNSKGKWESGMLSSWSRCNNGYAQKFGYFEIRAKLPSGAGFWPAFWLIGVDRSEGTVEVDIFEYYSHRTNKVSLNIHKHKGGPDDKKVSFGKRHIVTPGVLSEKFHTYGAELTEDEVIFYLDREEIWRTPAPEEFRQPMYILVSLAAEEYRMDENTPASATMEIDYIHAYQRKSNRL